MTPQTVHATTAPAGQVPLAAVRAAVLGRRFGASPPVAALLAELCFGTADRDNLGPASTTAGVRR